MENAQKSTNQFAPDTDRAVSSLGGDKFGYREIAQKLAPSLIAATKTDGMVIGIEGKWGSGKTSLLNFLVYELDRLSDHQLRVINLPPWLQGETEALIDALLSQMTPALEQEEKQRSPKQKWYQFNKRKVSEIGRLMADYAAKTGRGLSPLLKLGGEFVPYLSKAGKTLELGSRYLDNSLKNSSVSDLKQQIVDRLAKSQLKFVVLIDDLDRLEPEQTTEVIRIIRSVADFPHVVYCLCYDREVLTHALEHGMSVRNGHAYLQKVVQQTFAMPLPEPFDLRNALLEQLHQFYEEVHGKPIAGEEAEDLRTSMDREGNRLEVPRDISVVLNAIKFIYPQLKTEVYFPDVCWIQLVRAKRPELYFWIESYLSTHSVVTTSSASVDKSSVIKMGTELLELLPDNEDVSSQDSIWNLTSYVPGLAAKSEPENCVFQTSANDEINEFVSKRRIGSPIHSRLYFAFAIPKILMSEQDWDALEKLAITNVSELANRLNALAREKRPVGGSWFSHVVDRLDQQKLRNMSKESLAGWAVAICDSMDEVLRRDNEIAAFTPSTADKTKFKMQQIVKELRKKDSSLAEKTIVGIFETSPSINWLVGDLFRRELFDHGLAGDRATPEDCALTATEMEHIRQILKGRLKNKSLRSKIGDFPDLSGFLFGWRDLAGLKPPKYWVKQHIASDLNFLRFLMAMRGWSASDRVYYPLREGTIKYFLSWKAMLERVESLAKSGEAEIAKLADEVLYAISLGKDE